MEMWMGEEEKKRKKEGVNSAETERGKSIILLMKHFYKFRNKLQSNIH